VLVGASLHEVTTTTQTLLAALAVAGLAAVGVAALGVGALVRRGLRPLDAMAVAVEGIDAHDLDRRVALRAPPVEVTRLARAFDAMLVHLHASFATQRRFVGDAAHELRTPLAAIRGRGDVLHARPGVGRRDARGGCPDARRGRADGPAGGEPAAAGARRRGARDRPAPRRTRCAAAGGGAAGARRRRRAA